MAKNKKKSKSAASKKATVTADAAAERNVKVDNDVAPENENEAGPSEQGDNMEPVTGTLSDVSLNESAKSKSINDIHEAVNTADTTEPSADQAEGHIVQHNVSVKDTSTSGNSPELETELKPGPEEGAENPDPGRGDDDDDDFGSFDEASFEEYEQAESPIQEAQTEPDFHENALVTTEKISRTLDYLFPEAAPKNTAKSGSLLGEEAVVKFHELSKTPHLQPPNWTKSKLRHNLLLKLGIPINLDELVTTGSGKKHESSKRQSISESDLDWAKFDVPEIDSLHLTQEVQNELFVKTADILSEIETENMNNTSELYLQKCSAETLDSKLSQIQKNYTQLLKLSSLWHSRIEDLKASQNVFESVVQNMVGYNQKIQRNELLESLRRSKTKRGKKTF